MRTVFKEVLALLTSRINTLEVTVPPSFAGILPVSPDPKPFTYEIETFRGLQSIVRPGMTVLDVGCNFGVTTTLIGLLMSRQGEIHAFDGNESVIVRAKELVSANGIKNVRWNCTLVGEAERLDVPFYAVPGFGSPASTRNPDIRVPHGDAELRHLPMVSLDAYCARLDVVPACIKVDVEGAECSILQGAKRILEEVRPAWIIETHGKEILGIMGSLEEMIGKLYKAEYRFRDLATDRSVAHHEYVERYRHRIGHLLALPS